MTIFGYARVSTTHQKFDSQLDALSSYGVDYVYKEQESGMKQNRPVLKKLLLRLKSGDTLVIFKLDRLARGTRELLHLIELFEKENINFISIQNHIDTGTPTGKLLFTIMGAFAEMEANLIRERVIAGLTAAKNRGVKLGRPSPTAKIDRAIELYLSSSLTVREIATSCGISIPTLYKHLKLRGIALRGH